MLVPLLGALAALVVAAGAFVVLRNKSEEVDSPHATYRDALVKPKALPAAATKPSSARTDQAKIDAEARARAARAPARPRPAWSPTTAPAGRRPSSWPPKAPSTGRARPPPPSSSRN